MIHTALKQIRGAPIAFTDIFAGGACIFSGLGLQLLMGSLGLLGLRVCCVGIFFAPGITFLACPILLDQRDDSGGCRVSHGPGTGFCQYCGRGVTCISQRNPRQ